jgi:hypothetical protein
VAAGEALLLALQGQALVREAMASAALALYAAAALPSAAPGAVARCFAQGLLLPDPAADQGSRNSSTSGSSTRISSSSSNQFVLLLPEEAAAGQASAAASASGVGLLDAHLLRQGGGGLACQLRRLTPLNRVCAIRGEHPAEVWWDGSGGVAGCHLLLSSAVSQLAHASAPHFKQPRGPLPAATGNII